MEPAKAPVRLDLGQGDSRAVELQAMSPSNFTISTGNPFPFVFENVLVATGSVFQINKLRAETST